MSLPVPDEPKVPQLRSGRQMDSKLHMERIRASFAAGGGDGGILGRSSSSSDSQHHVPRSHPALPPPGIQHNITAQRLPMRYAGYQGSATVIRHNAFGMSRHPFPLGISGTRLPPGVNPSMVRHRVFVIPKESSLHPSNSKAICHPSAVLLRRRVTTRTVSTSTELSAGQLEEMEKKVKDFDIYKTAFEEKMRKEMETKEKVSGLESRCDALSTENSELRDEVEKLKEIVKTNECENQALILKAKKDKKEFEWKQSCYQNEIQRFEKRLERMHGINKNFIDDWNGLSTKHTAAMTAFENSLDDNDEEGQTTEVMPCLSKQGEPEATTSGKQLVASAEMEDEECNNVAGRRITRLISGTLPPPLISSTQKPVVKKMINVDSTRIRHTTDLSKGADSFTCTCGKAFTQKKGLKHHIRSSQRNLQKSFSCTFCLKKFTWGYMLRQHEKQVHKILRPRGHVACQICGCHFPSWKQLAHHKIQRHNSSRRKEGASSVHKIASTTHRRSI